MITHPIHINNGSDNDTINFSSDEHFGLTNIGQLGLEANTTVGKKREASSNVICSVYGPYSNGLSRTQLKKKFHHQIYHLLWRFLRSKYSRNRSAYGYIKSRKEVLLPNEANIITFTQQTLVISTESIDVTLYLHARVAGSALSEHGQGTLTPTVSHVEGHRHFRC